MPLCPPYPIWPDFGSNSGCHNSMTTTNHWAMVWPLISMELAHFGTVWVFMLWVPFKKSHFDSHKDTSYLIAIPHSCTYLFNGMSLFFSTQLRYTLIRQFRTSCSTDRIGPTFWAPLDTGSTIAAISNAGSDPLWAGSLMTLKHRPCQFMAKFHTNPCVD